MTLHIPDGLTVETVPIQSIRHGDSVVTYSRDGQEYVFEVDNISFSHTKGSTATVTLETARETDPHGNGLTASVTAPLGTPIERIVRKASE